MPIARIAVARSRPCRRSRCPAAGRSGQSPSCAAARRGAASRPPSGGGVTSRTVAPRTAGCRSARAAAPGSRSSTRSPTCSGSGSRSVSRAIMPPSTRTRATVRAEPDVQGQLLGAAAAPPRLAARRARGPACAAPRGLGGPGEPGVHHAGQRPAARLHQRHPPGQVTAAGAAQWLSCDLRATPRTCAAGHWPRDWMPRTRTGRIEGVTRSSSPPRMRLAERSMFRSRPFRCR